jgi:hypothetical protein
MSGFAPAEGEQFFIGLRAFGGEAMRLDAERSLATYLRWGYLGREILVNKASQRERVRTLLPLDARRRILEGLIRKFTRLTVGDYLEAVGGGLSRRQAELDLRRCPRLLGRGRTRGRPC